MTTKRGKPSLYECKQAFSRIVDLLDGEFDPENEDDTTHDGILQQVSDIAAGFWADLEDVSAEVPRATV